METNSLKNVQELCSGHFVMLTPHDQLRGPRTEFADWHAKVTLYKVSPGLRINIKIDTVMY